MSARHGQGYATWLVMLPLLVVPLIAVFGVPQFTLISTRTADGAFDDEPGLQLELGEDAPLAEAVPPFPGGAIDHAPSTSSTPNREGWSDPFENPGELSSPPPATSPRELALNSGSNEFVDPFRQPESPASPAPRENPWAQPPTNPNSGIDSYSRSPENRDVPNFAPAAPPSEPEVALTWRQAVARLNKLGVQKFELSQTEEPFVFQFVCDLSKPDNPRITHRFEAKAGEPLKAVENVIQQVELWSAQQTPR